MHPNHCSDELSIDLLMQDFNSRSFLMFLRRQNERNQEISMCQYNRQHPTKYCAFDKLRGFNRLIDFQSTNPKISSHIISDNGILITNDLSQQLLNDNLSLVCHHWQQSKIKFSNKIEHIQSELHIQTNTSLKRSMNECHKILSNWISKNRLR